MTLWLSERLILAMHDIQLAEHGGGTGLRDAGLLAGALARPLNRAGYGEPDMAEWGAIYAMGIARSHPFIDGNERAAFSAMVVFFALNGLSFEVNEAEAVLTMLSMAAGDTDEAEFVTWVRKRVCPPT